MKQQKQNAEANAMQLVVQARLAYFLFDACHCRATSMNGIKVDALSRNVERTKPTTTTFDGIVSLAEIRRQERSGNPKIQKCMKLCNTSRICHP